MHLSLGPGAVRKRYVFNIFEFCEFPLVFFFFQLIKNVQHAYLYIRVFRFDPDTTFENQFVAQDGGTFTLLQISKLHDKIDDVNVFFKKGQNISTDSCFFGFCFPCFVETIISLNFSKVFSN